MYLSGFATLKTIITPITYSIIVAIITVFFTEYIRRRITSTRSQKIFLFALKDYDNEFLNDYNVVKHRINISLIGQSIGGIIAVVLLTIKYSYALNSLLQYITLVIVILVIVILRLVVPVFIILSIKNSRQAYIAKAAAWGILIDPTASLIVSIFAFLFLLFLLQLWYANFKQNNLEILSLYLLYWLIFAYLPTAVVWYASKDVRPNTPTPWKYITTSWEFMLVNLLISDLKTSFWLTVKLNCCHEANGKLLQVNNFGFILEVFKCNADNSVKNYVPWQEVVSIEIEKTKI